MRIFPALFVRVFLARLGVVFLLVQIFLALGVLLGFLARHPHLPLLGLVARMPDLTLVLLPVSLPFSALLGVCLTLHHARRHRGLLAIHLAGRDPRRDFLPVILVAAAFSAGMWWLQTSVLPPARLHVRDVVRAVREAGPRLALQLAEDPELFPGYEVDFGLAEGGGFERFHLLSRDVDRPRAIVARTAEIAIVDDEDLVRLDLRQGRLLRLDEDGSVELNLGFDRVRLDLDLATLEGPPKAALLNLEYYTDEELDRLEEQRRSLRRMGIRLGRTQRRRIAGVGEVRAVRVQSALTTLLFVSVAVVFLGAHRPTGTRRRVVLIVLFCLVVLLPETLVLESRANRGRLESVWSAFLPTFEVCAVVALFAFWRRRGGAA